MAGMEIHELSLRALAEGIRARRFSAREALDAHLTQLASVNPAVNAVVTLDEEGARARAAAADERTASGAELGPLHGVPMTHKDTHDTAGMRTTFGSPIYRDRVPDGDSEIIARLKRAGVNSTGKSNVPEFAAGSHTFNPLFGTTTNPYDPTRSAGGSSGGAAAARVQAAGDGSDMGGSLRTPAAFCNIAGFRPSAGRIPAVPTPNPHSWLAREGVLAREIADIAFLMEILAGPDPRSALSSPESGEIFRAELRHELTGLRIGWTADFGLAVPVQPEILRLLESRLGVFEELGAVVESACPDFRDADEVFATTRAFDFALAYGELLPGHRDRIKESVIWNVEKGLALTSGDLIGATLARGRLHEATNAFFRDFDLLVTPATQVLPFPAQLEYPRSVNGIEFETYLDWMRAATLVSATGLPSISVPAGFSDSGLPIGLQFVAPENADVALLHAAHAFEQATNCAATAPTLTV
jgi:amidase